MQLDNTREFNRLEQDSGRSNLLEYPQIFKV